MAKVLFYDIETAPNLAYVWGKYQQDAIEIPRSWYMMAFGYKWEGQKSKVLALPDFELYATDPDNDRDLVEALWKLFDEADVVIAHNGDKFDMRKANARFVFHYMNPPNACAASRYVEGCIESISSLRATNSVTLGNIWG